MQYVFCMALCFDFTLCLCLEEGHHFEVLKHPEERAMTLPSVVHHHIPVVIGEYTRWIDLCVLVTLMEVIEHLGELGLEPVVGQDWGLLGICTTTDLGEVGEQALSLTALFQNLDIVALKDHDLGVESSEDVCLQTLEHQWLGLGGIEF